METVALMRRTDTKFVVKKEKLEQILSLIHQDYQILEINGKRLMLYNSSYFDTDEFIFYHKHHCQRKVRAKVRVREYVDSGIQFIEVKQKTNKGQTVKTRIETQKDNLVDKTNQFAQKHLALIDTLQESLRNDFKRFTLASKALVERVTIDVDIRFNEKTWHPNLAIIELKQAQLRRNSPLFQTLKKLSIQPSRISKYCLGMSTEYPQLKTNNFKPIFRNIHKQLL